MIEDHLESLLRCWSVDDCKSMPEKTVELIKVAAERLDAAEACIADLRRQLIIVEGALEMSQSETNLALDEYAEAQNHGLDRAALILDERAAYYDSQGSPHALVASGDAAAIRALKAGSHG